MSSEGAIEAEVVQNTAPLWERVAPACVDTLNLGCLLHLGTLAAVLPLCRNPRLGAAGATRSQGGAADRLPEKRKILRRKAGLRARL